MTKQQWDERRRQRLERKKLAIRMADLMADNARRPANTLNGVSFAELMRMLGGGV